VSEKKEKPHILVTNDDGVHAPGLLALASALRLLGNISILAPERNWSASGHQKTLSRPLRVKEVTLADGTAAYASDGAPSDCVALAILGYFSTPLDIVVSGINPTNNLGHDVTYSGTVTNAIEAAIWGLPGIAISLDTPSANPGEVDYAPAATVAKRVVEAVIQQGLPQDVLLSVNIPYLPLDKLTEFRITRQGRRVYRDVLVRREDPWAQPYYWIGGEFPTGIPEEDTDVGAVEQGYISITPLHLDMTAYSHIDMLKKWKFPAD
jgi:5'-nucleotidase